MGLARERVPVTRGVLIAKIVSYKFIYCISFFFSVILNPFFNVQGSREEDIGRCSKERQYYVVHLVHKNRHPRNTLISWWGLDPPDVSLPTAFLQILPTRFFSWKLDQATRRGRYRCRQQWSTLWAARSTTGSTTQSRKSIWTAE